MSETEKIANLLTDEITKFLNVTRKTREHIKTLCAESHRVRGGLSFSGFKEIASFLKALEQSGEELLVKISQAEQQLSNLRKKLKPRIK